MTMTKEETGATRTKLRAMLFRWMRRVPMIRLVILVACCRSALSDWPASYLHSNVKTSYWIECVLYIANMYNKGLEGRHTAVSDTLCFQ
jgi:hypothetical protein